MADNKSTSSGGIGFAGMLAILFIGLKLTGYIDWPWLWVLSPLWIGIVLIFGVLLVFGIIAGIAAVLESRSRVRRRW
jgi:hypothetical protein